MGMRNKIFKILLIIAAIGAAFSIFAAAKTYYVYWKSKNLPGFQVQKIFEEAEKNDIWGGKTPQETYEMYYSALKKGDIDLASKYFAGVEGKARAKKWLEEMKEKGELGEYISKLPRWEELKEKEYWDPDGKEFVLIKYRNQQKNIRLPDGKGGFVTVEAPSGNYTALDVVFQLSYPDKKIWKLSNNILVD